MSSMHAPGQATPSDTFGDSDVDDEDLPEEGASQLQSTGRISAQNLIVIQQDFADIAANFQRLQRKTNMPFRRLLQQFNSVYGDLSGNRAQNHWNIYQSYYQDHRVEERARLRLDTEETECEYIPTSTRIQANGIKTYLPIAPEDHDREVIQQCYKAFQDQYKDEDAWKVILDTYSELKAVDRSEMTLSQRDKAFNKSIENIANLVS